MGVVYQRQRLSDYSSEISLRNDFKYINSLSKEDKSFYTFKEIFDFVEYTSTNLEELEEFLYSEIGDVSKNGDVNPVLISFNDRNEENESLFKKIEKGDIIKPLKGDILISKIRPYLNKNVLIGDEEIYYTKAFIHIRPKINSEIFYFAIRTIFYNQLNAVSRQGKGYPTLKEDDLKTIRFSKHIIDSFINNEDVILSKTNPLNAEISNLKNSKLKPLDIINKVFGDEFGFDWEEFEKQKKQKTYFSNLNEFANNIDCRMGLKFHNLAGKYLHSFLDSNTTKKVKDYIEEPILLGKSISPSDYDEDGEYFYIAMSNIKTYAFDPEDCKKVTEEYSKSNLKKTVQKGDILLARSGEGTIGKVALIEDEDLNAIFADFTQRIRLTNYNTLFAYYFFRSEFFQYLVYTHKKGLGNNTNIFPSQIQEFPIPDWNEEKQTEIVEKIKSQIDAQSIIDNQIEQKLQQINGIIENAIKTE